MWEGVCIFHNKGLIKVTSYADSRRRASVFPHMQQHPNGQQALLLHLTISQHICPIQADVWKWHSSSGWEGLSPSRSGTQCFLNWNHFAALPGPHAPHPGGGGGTAARINRSIPLILWSDTTQAPMMPLKGAAPAIFSTAAAAAGSISSLLRVEISVYGDVDVDGWMDGGGLFLCWSDSPRLLDLMLAIWTPVQS